MAKFFFFMLITSVLVVLLLGGGQSTEWFKPPPFSLPPPSPPFPPPPPSAWTGPAVSNTVNGNLARALLFSIISMLYTWWTDRKRTGEIIIKHLNKEQEADQSHFRDPATNAELEVQEKTSLLEWFANEYKRFSCTFEFVTNKSQEGSQFCRGFGGIGGILSYQLDVRSFDDISDGEVDEDSD